MSLYREARGRRVLPLLAVAAIATPAGLLIGVLVAGSDEPDLAEAVEALQDDVQPGIQALELVSIEYGQGLGGGAAAAGTEDEAAQIQLETAQEIFAAAESELALIAPAEARETEAALAQLSRRMEARAPAAAVERLATNARESLASAARIEVSAAG
jgi:hypothetical protein